MLVSGTSDKLAGLRFCPLVSRCRDHQADYIWGSSGLSEPRHNCGSEGEKKFGTNQSGSHSTRILGVALKEIGLIPVSVAASESTIEWDEVLVWQNHIKWAALG